MKIKIAYGTENISWPAMVNESMQSSSVRLFDFCVDTTIGFAVSHNLPLFI
ncbi:MAG: hypothetical protein V2B20_19480 [Pseudomonadota bacterium]